MDERRRPAGSTPRSRSGDPVDACRHRDRRAGDEALHDHADRDRSRRRACVCRRERRQRARPTPCGSPTTGRRASTATRDANTPAAAPASPSSIDADDRTASGGRARVRAHRRRGRARRECRACDPHSAATSSAWPTRVARPGSIGPATRCETRDRRCTKPSGTGSPAVDQSREAARLCRRTRHPRHGGHAPTC